MICCLRGKDMRNEVYILLFLRCPQGTQDSLYPPKVPIQMAMP